MPDNTEMLVKELLAMAERHSDFTRKLAEDRNSEYRARGDTNPNYGWVKPEDTIYGRAALALQSTAGDDIARLIELEPLVSVCTQGDPVPARRIASVHLEFCGAESFAKADAALDALLSIIAKGKRT